MKNIYFTKLIFKSHKGFTLLEVIVATGIFAIVFLVASTIFITAINGQRKVFSLQIVQENGRYITESVSKEIRTAKIISDNGSTNILEIKNAKDEAVTYSFENNQLKRNGLVLNSGKVKVSGKFYVQNMAETSQPRVTMVMTIKYNSDLLTQQAKINLETTISSRAY